MITQEYARVRKILLIISLYKSNQTMSKLSQDHPIFLTQDHPSLHRPNIPRMYFSFE